MYSKWHKIDLHIHTNKSNETKENDYKGIFDINVLKNRLNENSIEMISLTDHNIINCHAYDQLFKACDIKAFVGVELDVAISEEELRQYVSSLAQKGNKQIEIKPFHVVLIFKSENYSEINELLDKMYEQISTNELNSDIDLNANKKFRVTTFKYILQTFRDHSFFIIAHGDKKKGIVPPYKKAGLIPEAQYNILMGEISAIEMRSNIKMKNAIESYNEGFQNLLKDDFRQNPSPYVVFSDNHDCNTYSHSNLCTWLKGKLNYESLRIGFSDPESRIHTSTKKPSFPSYYLDNTLITDCNSKQSKIYFSPQLNVIIGGRSSGKSFLFNTLINLNTTVSPNEKEVFKNNYKKLVNIDETKAQMNIGPLENSIALEAEVYCQENIIKLFDNDEDLKSKLVKFFPDFKNNEIEANEIKIKETFNELKKCYRKMHECLQNIYKKDRCNIIKKSIQTSSKIFNVDSEQLYVGFEIEHHDTVHSKLHETKESINEIVKTKFKNENLFSQEEQERIKHAISLVQNKIDLVNESKAKTKIISYFFAKVQKICDTYIKQELDQELQEIESAISLLNKDILDYKCYFIAKLRLRKICKKIEQLDISIENKQFETDKYIFISKLNLKLNKDIIVRQLFEDAILNYDLNKSIYLNLLDLVDPAKEYVRIKQKTGQIGKAPETIDKKINEFVSTKQAKKSHEIIEKGSISVSTASTSQGRKASIFLDIKLDSFLNANRPHVLMIDQIEDNIDNKYISKDLVEAIRQLKNYMQIILVTHNPSIAVYGDAENIIICENQDGQINFKQGGLEDEEIRHEACQILDGGDIAFKNRMDKYNIAKIKNDN
jgi:hypothetical protein